MKSKISIVFLLISFICSFCLLASCGNKKDGLTKEEYKKLVIFSKKIKEIVRKSEEEWLVAKDIEQLLGKPNAINLDDGMKIKEQKRVWRYFHPCYATVRYLFFFDNYGRLIFFTCIQANPSGGEDRYHNINFFLAD